jgi:hypothetical protein
LGKGRTFSKRKYFSLNFSKMAQKISNNEMLIVILAIIDMSSLYDFPKTGIICAWITTLQVPGLNPEEEIPDPVIHSIILSYFNFYCFLLVEPSLHAEDRDIGELPKNKLSSMTAHG